MRAIRTARAAPVATTALPVRNTGRVLRRTTAQVIPDTTKEEAIAEIESCLQSIAKQNAIILAAATLNAENEKTITAALHRAKMVGWTTETMKAQLKNTYSRETRDIDPEAFAAEVDGETFYACIKVSVTEAKKFLTEAALDVLAPKAKAEKTGEVLEVTEVKRKVAKVK